MLGACGCEFFELVASLTSLTSLSSVVPQNLRQNSPRIATLLIGRVRLVPCFNDAFLSEFNIEVHEQHLLPATNSRSQHIVNKSDTDSKELKNRVRHKRAFDERMTILTLTQRGCPVTTLRIKLQAESCPFLREMPKSW